jgi:hypothetical protein
MPKRSTSFLTLWPALNMRQIIYIICENVRPLILPCFWVLFSIEHPVLLLLLLLLLLVVVVVVVANAGCISDPIWCLPIIFRIFPLSAFTSSGSLSIVDSLPSCIRVFLLRTYFHLFLRFCAAILLTVLPALSFSRFSYFNSDL